jgi:hypothetical protein
MRLSRQIALAAITLAIGACAALGSGDSTERNAQLRLDRGLSALEAGRYGVAFDDLAWVYAHCSDQEAGMDALRALAALELDPRNSEARPDIGATLLARLIRGPMPRPTRSLTETTFLTSVALGAPHPADIAPPEATTGEDPHRTALAPQAGEESVYGCGSALPAPADPDRALPRLPGPSMAELLTAAEAARDSATTRADSLGLLLEVVQEQLIATREELQRIRRTLKP